MLFGFFFIVIVRRNSSLFLFNAYCLFLNGDIIFIIFDKRSLVMAFVVTEQCIRCKFSDCVEVCPVDCFYEGPNFLVINPDECIDCALCEPECPVNAIMSEDDLAGEQKQFTELNRELSQKWPNITSKKESPTDAKDWQNVENKLQYLEKDWPSE